MCSALRGQTGMAFRISSFRTIGPMFSFSQGNFRFFASLLFCFARTFNTFIIALVTEGNGAFIEMDGQ